MMGMGMMPLMSAAPAASAMSTMAASSLADAKLQNSDLNQLVYLRGHAWGDKLLRRLSPDQITQYLSEQPYVSSMLGASQIHTRSRHSRVSRSNTFRQNVRILAAKARRSESRTEPAETMATVATTDVSDDTYQRGNLWVVPGVGDFSNKVVYTFSGTALPTGLTASNNDELQGTAPYPFRFDAANVTVSDGTLNLKVPGGQDGRRKPISCAEVTTDETGILHASVRMTAKMSAQPGACHGAFFYRNDQAESDIEYLTDPVSKSNRANPDATQFWYSNQATKQGAQPSHQSADPPPTVEGYHTYRLDWTSEFTAYYVDGKLQSKLRDNIPDKSGLWVFNNWSNGDPGWSCGPPKNDSIFRIRDITMYYNTINTPQSS